MSIKDVVAFFGRVRCFFVFELNVVLLLVLSLFEVIG